jgi:glutathione peroxidase-family protein
MACSPEISRSAFAVKSIHEAGKSRFSVVLLNGTQLLFTADRCRFTPEKYLVVEKLVYRTDKDGLMVLYDSEMVAQFRVEAVAGWSEAQ